MERQPRHPQENDDQALRRGEDVVPAEVEPEVPPEFA